MSLRPHFALALLATLGMMGGALYLQYGQGLEPCPLCILQRIATIGFGLIALVALLHNPRRFGAKVYGWLLAASATAGLVVAGWHLWLQYNPYQGFDCAPGLDYMLQELPMNEVLAAIFRGNADCSQISWSLFGISIPGWSAAAFLLLLIWAAIILRNTWRLPR